MSDGLPELADLERAIEAYFDATDDPGVTLGAVVVVERRVENRGEEGSTTDRLVMCSPWPGSSSHARSLGLLYWGREWLMHGGPEDVER